MEIKIKTKKDFINAIDKELNDLVDRIFMLSQENIVKKRISDTGFLLKSGIVKHNYLEKEIIYQAPYSDYIEFGTQPHMPPVEPLQRYAKRKLRAKNYEEVGWAIANKIRKKGTKPEPFLRPAINEVLSKL